MTQHTHDTLANCFKSLPKHIRNSKHFGSGDTRDLIAKSYLDKAKAIRITSIEDSVAGIVIVRSDNKELVIADRAIYQPILDATASAGFLPQCLYKKP